MYCITFAVPGEPRDVFARPSNSSTIEVRWSPPDDSDKNGQIRGYQIYVKPRNVGVFWQYFFNMFGIVKTAVMSGQLCVVLINLLQHLTQSMSNPYYIPVKTIGTPPDVDRWNVSNLQPDTRYLVQVAAVTSKGDGKRSDKVRVDTPGGVPSMPRI